MLGKTIYSKLYAYFNDSKLCFDNQYGFRQKHLTEYASLELVDRINTQMDKLGVPFSIFTIVQLIYTYSELNMNLPKGVLGITCHVINNTLEIVTEKIGSHSLRSFANYTKKYLCNNQHKSDAELKRAK